MLEAIQEFLDMGINGKFIIAGIEICDPESTRRE